MQAHHELPFIATNRGLCAHPGARPHTTANALNDSPAGLAAWIVEKFSRWSDCQGDVYRSFKRDELRANLTVYWMTETISSSFRMYQKGRKAPLRFTADDFVNVPCSIAPFPKGDSVPAKGVGSATDRLMEPQPQMERS
jgi:hypothetical protein